jgi:hypothetical protein
MECTLVAFGRWTASPRHIQPQTGKAVFSAALGLQFGIGSTTTLDFFSTTSKGNWARTESKPSPRLPQKRWLH